MNSKILEWFNKLIGDVSFELVFPEKEGRLNDDHSNRGNRLHNRHQEIFLRTNTNHVISRNDDYVFIRRGGLVEDNGSAGLQKRQCKLRKPLKWTIIMLQFLLL